MHKNSHSDSQSSAHLYMTETRYGLPPQYPPNREVACATCSPPLGSGAVYTRWGARDCPSNSTLLYEGVMAGGGGGYNFVCLHSDPQQPAAYDAAKSDRDIAGK